MGGFRLSPPYHLLLTQSTVFAEEYLYVKLLKAIHARFGFNEFTRTELQTNFPLLVGLKHDNVLSTQLVYKGFVERIGKAVYRVSPLGFQFLQR